MRKFVITLIAGGLAVSGCATSPYGMGGDPLAGILGGILGGGVGGGGYNQNMNQFQQEAVNACGQEASRYGQVRISDARQEQQDIVVVYGQVQTQQGYARQFTCAYRSDRRIVDFQIR